MTAPLEPTSEGFLHVQRALAQRGHPHAPRWLDVAARTSAQAAEALGVAVGQIAKCVVFRRLSDDAAVLVVASGDRRVDEAKVAAQAGAIGRADAAFVKTKTGYSIGGVSPIGHASACVLLLDCELLRFDAVWAAAGHPNGVFMMSPSQLCALTGASFTDVTLAPGGAA